MCRQKQAMLKKQATAGDQTWIPVDSPVLINYVGFVMLINPIKPIKNLLKYFRWKKNGLMCTSLL